MFGDFKGSSFRGREEIVSQVRADCDQVAPGSVEVKLVIFLNGEELSFLVDFPNDLISSNSVNDENKADDVLIACPKSTT